MTRGPNAGPGPQPVEWTAAFLCPTTSWSAADPAPTGPASTHLDRHQETIPMTTEVLPNGVNATAVLAFAHSSSPMRPRVARHSAPRSTGAVGSATRSRFGTSRRPTRTNPSPGRHEHGRQSGGAGPRRPGQLPGDRLRRRSRSPEASRSRPPDRARRQRRPARLLRPQVRPRRLRAGRTRPSISRPMRPRTRSTPSTTTSSGPRPSATRSSARLALDVQLVRA